MSVISDVLFCADLLVAAETGDTKMMNGLVGNRGVSHADGGVSPEAGEWPFDWTLLLIVAVVPKGRVFGAVPLTMAWHTYRALAPGDCDGLVLILE